MRAKKSRSTRESNINILANSFPFKAGWKGEIIARGCSRMGMPTWYVRTLKRYPLGVSKSNVISRRCTTRDGVRTVCVHYFGGEHPETVSLARAPVYIIRNIPRVISPSTASCPFTYLPTRIQGTLVCVVLFSPCLVPSLNPNTTFSDPNRFRVDSRVASRAC